MMRLDAIKIGKRHRRDMGNLDDLVTSIREIGMLHPVVITPDGQLIAGARRLNACRMLEMTEVPVTVIDIARVSRGEYAENAFRKAFTPSEMVAITDELEAFERAEAKKRQASGRNQHSEPSAKFAEPSKGDAREKVAKATGKSHTTLDKAREVVKAAKAEPVKYAALQEKMDRTGKVDGSFKELKKTKRKEEIIEAAANVPPATERFRLFHGSISDLLTEPHASVDIICTDPPYPGEFLPLFDTLGSVAAHLLRPGGILICMSGQTHLPDVIASLTRHLNYWWTLAYLTPGGQATQIFPRKVNTFWKPVLLFGKGDYGADWFGDVTRSDVNDNDKSHHDWGQSLSGMTDLMKRFVRPGHLVVDPFLGGGTTAIAALNLGATFLGCDTSREAIDATKARLADAKLV